MHYHFLKSVLAMQGEATDSASANLWRKKVLEDVASKLDSQRSASASSAPKASPYQQERKQVLKKDMATLSSLIRPANPQALSCQLSASDWLRLVKIFFQCNKGRFPLDCLVGSSTAMLAVHANLHKFAPVELPVLPTSAIGSPASTCWPTVTSRRVPESATWASSSATV